MSVLRTGGVRYGEMHALAPIYDDVVDFDRPAFTRLLKNKGYSVLWQKATFCPNRTGLVPRGHAIDCTICNGSGFLYYDDAVTQMLVTSVSLNQSYFAYGRFDAGQIMVTGLPEARLHEWDRLILQNGVARFHELVARRDSGSDRLKYPPLRVNHVAWIDRDRALHTATYERDFLSEAGDNSGSLLWTADIRPDPQSFYSVSYEYRPRYVVLDLVHQHRESTVNGQHVEFPVQAAAKLEYLIRDESRDAADVIDRDVFALDGSP